MKTASLSEAKDRLSELVDQVRNGETVRILVHGRAAADLVPIGRQQGWDDETELQELERLRIVRRGRKPPDDEILREKPVPAKGRQSASRILVSERRGGR